MFSGKPWITLLALVLVGSEAAAQAAITHLGELVCNVGSAIKDDAETATVGESREVVCFFTPADKRPQETYKGTLRTSGVNEDLSGKSVVMFAVIGTRKSNPMIGLLEQTFVGSVVDSNGAKMPLAGDADSSVMLNLIGRGDVSRPGNPVAASVELTLWSTSG